jgi:hypothetical protein
MLLISLTGCNLFSDNPLSDPNQDAIDSSIIGTWSWHDEDDSGFVHIGTDPARKAFLITMIEFKKDGGVGTTEFKGHTTKLSSHRYLNLKWTNPKEMDKGYFFVEYKVDADILECSLLDGSAFEKAIRDGSLKGEVLNPNGIMPTILLHADQNRLRQYITQNASSLVKNSAKLSKVLPSNNSLKSGGEKTPVR